MTDVIRETILSIYDTVADQSLWPQVLHRFAEQLNARGCVLFEWHDDNNNRRLVAPFFSSIYDSANINAYIEKCFEYEAVDQDIFEEHSLQSDGIDVIDDSVLTNSIAELKQRENVKMLLKFNILHRAAGLLNKDNTSQSRFSVQFGAARGRVTPDERQHMGLILPHIAKALDLASPAKQLASQHQSMFAAMDRLSIGLCILDAGGRIALSNEEFKRQQETYQTFVTRAGGELQITNGNDQKRFSALKSDVMKHGQFGARPRKEAITANTDTFLCIEVTPLTKPEEIGSKTFGGFMLYSTDTSLPVHCNTQPIKRAFGLTDAELALVDMIAEGLTNRQIAERRERSVATINAQVKTILSKTNCATRTQFVRVMMSFGAVYTKAKK